MTEQSTDEPGYSPGVGSEGLTDPDVLTGAHRRAIGNEPYQILIEGQGSAAPVDPGGSHINVGTEAPRWLSFRQRVSVANANVFRSQVTALRQESNGSETVVYDDYTDGEITYRRYRGDATPEFIRLSSTRSPLYGATPDYCARISGLETPASNPSRRDTTPSETKSRQR